MTPTQNNQRLALTVQLAIKNARRGGGPFAAIVTTDKGKIVAIGVNQVMMKKDPTAHAEIVAIRQACRKLNTHHLKGYRLYTSSAPCILCFGAIYWSGLKKIYAASSKKRAENFGFDEGPVSPSLWKAALREKRIRYTLKIPPGIDPAKPFLVYKKAGGKVY
ncbi:MAG: nucleoside deaminase [Deltaproteobacteria bacterium]|nr:nucleoside deaminase [Deltaproteobacteria bacterium]